MSRMGILDHGYLEVIESWGSDESIITSARMSTDKGFQGWGPVRFCPDHDDEVSDGPGYPSGGSPLWACPQCGKWSERPGDERLLAYLWNNKHATPFEMAGAIIEVQAPIFVFREWHRHRSQSFNELSARYTPMPDLNYVPTFERMMLNAGGTNKQAGTVAGAEELTDLTAEYSRVDIARSYREAERDYQTMLDRGVPKELARLVLPVGRYSRMRASANLRNWLAFLALRNHPAAQWEIRQYAAALQVELVKLFPRTIALFEGGAA